MIKVNVGDIVLADYLDFSNEIKRGMFLVYSTRYKGQEDLYDLSVIKISTHSRNFQVMLKSDVLRFLHYDSYINCTDTHVISTSQVKFILGAITSNTMMIVKRQLKNAMRSSYEQIDKYIESGMSRPSSYSENPRRGGLTLDGNTLMLDGKPLTKEILKSILIDD